MVRMVNLYRISGMLPVNKKVKILLKNRIDQEDYDLSQKEAAWFY